jgi:cyclase
VVIGIDSREEHGNYFVYQYTGDPDMTKPAQRQTIDWVAEVQERGAGEIVLNCMNQDGMRKGYDAEQLRAVRSRCTVPLIASGGAGELQHFYDVFSAANVDGALAASVFHSSEINIGDLKQYLAEKNISVRI